MFEVLSYYRSKIEASLILDKLRLKRYEYFVVSYHREENVDSENNFTNLIESLNAIANKYHKRIIVSTHPRTRKRITKIGKIDFDKKIELLKPMGFFDYIALQMSALCVISDSGTITEESSLLGFPAVTIRQAHERPEGMDQGTLIMCGLHKEDVLDSLEVVMSQLSENDHRFKPVSDYDVDNVSQKVLRVIMSYTDYINRTVWYK